MSQQAFRSGKLPFARLVLVAAASWFASTDASAFSKSAVSPSFPLTTVTTIETLPGQNAPVSIEAAPLHKVHVAFGRMAVEDNVALIRVRFFLDDLTDALQKYHDRPDLQIALTPESDSLFLSYFGAHFMLSIDDSVLTGQIVSSGEETEAGQAIWWYAVQYESASAILAFSITNNLLFEVFDDQKNIVKIQHFPSEESFSYFFEPENDTFDMSFSNR